jgi:hypothetical protein
VAKSNDFVPSFEVARAQPLGPIGVADVVDVPQHVDFAKFDFVLEVHRKAATEFGLGPDRLHAPVYRARPHPSRAAGRSSLR